MSGFGYPVTGVHITCGCTGLTIAMASFTGNTRMNIMITTMITITTKPIS